MRIVFMGTPDFGAPCLQALCRAGYQVVGVCCQPDRRQGRGKRVMQCAVKTQGEDLGLPIYQFERLRSPEGVAAMRSLSPDFFVTAAFGQILSQELLDIPRLGTVNVHASLLPLYRGPAPVNWCLIEGQTQTGVTTMMTDAGIDTGDMLLQRALDILPGERAGELSGRLSLLGASLLVETLAALMDGSCPRTPQDHAMATRHPMLKKSMGQVDWTLPAEQIINRMRGLDPWPGIYTVLSGETLKIWDAVALPQQPEAPAGTVLSSDAKGGLRVATGAGVLEIITLQGPGGKRLGAGDFLRGHPIPTGTVFAPKEEARG